MEMKDVSSSGAQRNTIEDYRHDLVIREFIHSMAKIMAEGVKSHSEDNWKKGFDNPIKDIWNHVWEHERLYFKGDKSEDHLAKMAVGCMFQWYFDRETKHDGNGEVDSDREQDRHPSTTYGEKKGPSPKTAEELLAERYLNRSVST